MYACQPSTQNQRNITELSTSYDGMMKRRNTSHLALLLLATLSYSFGTKSALAAVPEVASFSWNGDKQGKFIVALAPGAQGEVWVGTEDHGVWRYNPQAIEGDQWTQFTSKDGLGDDNGYALAVDKLGRVWVGHLNHGVSVFNGQTWRNYGVLDGPLGERVFALAVCPTDGDVWIATNAGLTRYSTQRDSWSYFTTADGLPSNQIQSLAFDKDGNLYAGTQCDGLALATAADGYKTWRAVSGPLRPPTRAHGTGLPSRLINGVVVGRSGTVYVATPQGLARSVDRGRSWEYVRGHNYADKVRGFQAGAPDGWHEEPGATLREDYVTGVAEDEAGYLWIGYRQKGYEVFDPETGKPAHTSDKDAGVLNPNDYVTALLPLPQTPPLIGRYGSGLTQSTKFFSRPNTAGNAWTPPGATTEAAPVPALPSPAKPPTVAELAALTAQLRVGSAALTLGQGAYLGEDWQTQGDWLGRYGRQYTRLGAMQSPLDNTFGFDHSYKVEAGIGPHHDAGDGLRHWVQAERTDNPKSLYNPVMGYRRQADWDDHGEVYAMEHEGPDVWVMVQVPTGIHRVSLYFFNKDGTDGSNRYRDYIVQLKPYATSLKAADKLPDLAWTRVHDFWGPVYKSFLVAGPQPYLFKISRNNSFNTIIQGVFIDKLQGPPSLYDNLPLAWMDNVTYAAPTLLPAAQNLSAKWSETARAAVQFWAALDGAYSLKAAPLQRPYRLLAYRALIATPPPSGMAPAYASLTANWRWRLPLWDAAQRDEFKAATNRSYLAFLQNNPQRALTVAERQATLQAIKEQQKPVTASKSSH